MLTNRSSHLQQASARSTDSQPHEISSCVMDLAVLEFKVATLRWLSFEPVLIRYFQPYCRRGKGGSTYCLQILGINETEFHDY